MFKMTALRHVYNPLYQNIMPVKHPCYKSIIEGQAIPANAE